MKYLQLAVVLLIIGMAYAHPLDEVEKGAAGKAPAYNPDLAATGNRDGKFWGGWGGYGGYGGWGGGWGGYGGYGGWGGYGGYGGYGGWGGYWG